MITSLTNEELAEYISTQINYFCPDKYTVKTTDILPYLDESMMRFGKCFENCLLDGYRRDNEVVFDHLHTDKYITLLYFLSNTIWKQSGQISLPSKIMNGIRIISGMFLSFKFELPEHFVFFHSVGSVIGNAHFEDYVMFYQNVTITTRVPNCSPHIGRGVFLAAGSKIVGNVIVGDRVSIGTNVLVYDEDVPDDSVCTLENGILSIRKRRKEKCFLSHVFDAEL